MTRASALGVAVACALASPSLGAGQLGGRPAAVPTAPVAAILEAFDTHPVVALTDPHGRVEMQAFLLSLIRDPRLPGVVNDIVLEGASARYQDVLDRFLRGDAIPGDAIRPAWEDTTQPQATGVRTAELVRAVRTINAALPQAQRLRVLAGDPPIDWSQIATREDHFRWIELRDSYPADLIRRQVLDRGRRALVIYGQGHAQRQQSFANYDMSTWQAQTLVSLLEHDGAHLFTVWTLMDPGTAPTGAASWPVPSLVRLEGTAEGAADFATYSVVPNRFAIQDGTIRPVPRDAWRPLAMERQFDALLYLGPPSAMTTVSLPPDLCADTRYLQTRLARIALAGLPAAEGEALTRECAAVTGP